MKDDADARRWLEDIKRARATWPEGPWTNEPDRVEWRFNGMPCLIVRSAVTGAWCGYAGVAKGHPVYGVPWGDLPPLSVHRGVNFADHCYGPVCHVPAPGETEDVYWIGFDCAHCLDAVPMTGVIDSLLGSRRKQVRRTFLKGETYRDVAYVRAAVERLAAQLAEMKP